MKSSLVTKGKFVVRVFSAAILGLAIPCCVFGQTYTINAFAGGALPVNIPGTSANLGFPFGVAVDGAGNLFFAEDAHHVVLRLDTTTGVLTLVAGNGTRGYSGDNGPAASAQLCYPSGVAVDSAGNVYIADSWNHRIRKVSNGLIATVAGSGSTGPDSGGYGGDNGLATSAQLYFPGGVAVDAAGNLYIADQDNERIRKVSNGVIATVAGNGVRGFSGDTGPAASAQSNSPTAVAVDATGNLYIADWGNNVVRKVSKGVITTVAGNGTYGYRGDSGPATSAELFAPDGVAVDSAGNLYVADSANNRIREVSNGVIATVAGNGTSGFSGDGGPASSAQFDGPDGVAVDSAGNLYIADYGNNRIRRVSNGVITTVAGGGTSRVGDGGPATSAQLASPQSVAMDSAGNLYINDGGYIREVSDGVITTVAGIGTQGFSGDSGPANSAELSSPGGVAVDSAGNVYIADTGNNRIRKISNGVMSTVAGNGTEGYSGDDGPATSAQLYYPSEVAVDAAGNLYITDSGNNRIRKVSNGVITTVAGSGAAGFAGDNGPATSAQLYYPGGIAVDAAGSLYITDIGSNRIRKVSNGVITTVAGNQTKGFSGDGGPASAQLNQPGGVAVDSAGIVYIADFLNQRIRKVADGVITTVAGSGSLTGVGFVGGFSGDNGPAASALLNGPSAVTVDAAGNVYIADALNFRIRVLTPSGASCAASVTPVALSPAASGGSFTVTIQTGSSCAWAIQGLPSWITFSGSAVGTGPGDVALNVAVNSGGPRTATVSVAGVSVAVTQQGAFSIAAVTNAASNRSGPISPGEIVALYGSGIGPAQLVKAAPGSNGSYGTQVANTSVSFNGIAAPMIYASAAQTAAVVPYGITGTNAQVTVTYQGQTSAAFSVSIASSAPGIFTFDSSGQGPAAAINQDGVTVNSAAAPAKIGDIISLYATGEGQTTPPGVDGKAASAPYPYPNLPVTVMIGFVNAPVKYAGGAPGMVAGLMQVNVQIPAGIQTGNTVTVFLQVGGVQSLGGVTIAVR
jgi:uncharacterized protein (TIGR03437 family)